MGTHGQHGVGHSGGSAKKRAAPRRDVGGDLPWKLISIVIIIDAFRSEHAPLIGAGLAIVLAGAGWFPDIRGEGVNQKKDMIDAS